MANGVRLVWTTFGLLWLATTVAFPGCGKSPGHETSDSGVNGNLDGGVISDVGPVSSRDAGPPVADDPLWAMFGGTAQRNGQSPVVGPRRGALKSVRLAADGLVVVESIGPAGHVYVWLQEASGGGQILALSPDGGEMWRFPSGAGPNDGVVAPGAALKPDGTMLVKGFIAVPSTDPTQMDLLFGLDLDGDVSWFWRELEPAVTVTIDSHAAVTYAESGAFYAVLGPFNEVGDESDRWLYAFRPDGSFDWKWDREVGRARVPLALASDGTLRVIKSESSGPQSGDNGLYALDETGAELWFYSRGIQPMNYVSVDGENRTYVTGLEAFGPVVASLEADGQEFFWYGWSGERTDETTTPVVHLPNGYFCVGASYFNDRLDPIVHGDIRCWAKGGAIERVHHPTIGDPCGAMVVDALDILYVVTVGNGSPPQVLGIAPDGIVGTRIFEVALPYEAREEGCHDLGLDFFAFAPALGDGRLYVGSQDGQLHIIE